MAGFWRFALFAGTALLLAACSTVVQQDFTVNSDTGRKRHLAVFLDGTANDASTRTNVARLFELTVNQNRSDIALYYSEGVGSDGRVLGALTGWGIGNDVRGAWIFLAERWRPDLGDKHYAFGFSRGAYAARILVGFTELAGMPRFRDELPAARKHVLLEELADDLYDAHKDHHDEGFSYAKREDRIREVYESPRWRGVVERMSPPPFEFVGLWDTVESLGIRGLFADATRPNVKYNDRLCGALTVRHAAALDENRSVSYAAQSILPPSLVRDCPNGFKPSLAEVWFPGAHADVGGGYSDTALPSLSLNWMLRALQSSGLVPANAAVWSNPEGIAHDAQRGNFAYRLIFLREQRPLLHYLCSQRGLMAHPDATSCVNDQGGREPVEGVKIHVHASSMQRLAKINDIVATSLAACPTDRTQCNYDSGWYHLPVLKACLDPTTTGFQLKTSGCAVIEVVNDW